MTTSGTMASGATPQVDLRYRVEGMDCSDCALKIESAVEQFGTAGEIQANYKTQVLEFRPDEAATPRTAVEEQIRKLGYGIAPLA